MLRIALEGFYEKFDNIIEEAILCGKMTLSIGSHMSTYVQHQFDLLGLQKTKTYKNQALRLQFMHKKFNISIYMTCCIFEHQTSQST